MRKRSNIARYTKKVRSTQTKISRLNKSCPDDAEIPRPFTSLAERGTRG